MTRCIERGICFREHVLLIRELGTAWGRLGRVKHAKTCCCPNKWARGWRRRHAGETLWLSPPSPSPRCFPGDCTGGSAGTLASPGREWPLLWLRLSSLPLSPSRLLAARLCSQKLIGAVNSRKRLSLGSAVVPASSIVQQFKASAMLRAWH